MKMAIVMGLLDDRRMLRSVSIQFISFKNMEILIKIHKYKVTIAIFRKKQLFYHL